MSNAPRGFSTLELMLALLILSSALAAIVLVTLGVPQALADGHEAEVGARIARANLTQQILIGANLFSAISPIASSTSGSYTTSLSVDSSLDGLSKLLTSSVSWMNERDQQKYLAFTALITDFSNASPNSCSNVLVGDWTHPSVFSFTMAPGDLLSLASATTSHPITVVSAGASTLAVAVESSVGKTDQNLFFFDISSSTHPAYLGSLDNASTTKTGFAALAQNDNMLYGASAYPANFATCKPGPACSQLQIIDISNPTLPHIIEDFQLPTTTSPYAIGSGSQSVGKSIFYANNRIYLGLQKTGSPQGEEFNIIDVQNPQAPVWLGGYSIGRTINQIEVVGEYAYLATDDPTRELVILDVHDPSHITLAGTYDAPGGSTYGFGEAVAVASTTVALGRSFSPNQSEFSFLSIASSTAPTLLGSSTLHTLTSITDVANIIIREFLAFVLTTSTLQFWNISDPTQPMQYAAPFQLPAGSTITGTNALACDGNTLYIASSDANHTGYLTVLTGS